MEKLYHIIEAQQFDRDLLENGVFPLADEMEKKAKSGGGNDLSGKGLVSFFEEPSTRTRASFEIAIKKLGGDVIFSTENAMEFSSRAKGESIEDTIKVICGYGPDAIVYRSKNEGMAQIAASLSSVPIINAGDGPGEHPTQALLDLYTIVKEKSQIDGISIAMCGDLANGRTVRSLSRLLTRFSDIKIYFISPKVVRMRDDIKDDLRKHDIWFDEGNDLHAVAPLVDVIYQTRVQKERGSIVSMYGDGFFKIGPELLSLMKKDHIIMHPLQRIDEIATEVDKDPRAAYFRQAENGLYVRMALLKMILT